MASVTLEFLQAAGVSGFEVLATPEGHWPKMRHKKTDLQVEVLPKGGRPGSAAHPAPTTIRHPERMGGQPGSLRYLSLPFLIELKLGQAAPAMTAALLN